MKNTINDYIDQNKARFLDELFEILRIPSISADKKYEKDVIQTAERIKDYLTKAGADNVRLIQTEGYPVVYGEKILDTSLPTVVVYGHYDVQPPDPVNLWDSDPFNPVLKDDKIYARGACDDKGQMFMHVKAFEMMLKNDLLTCNVKFMIEGEEEIGSANLAGFLKENKELLSGDVILISDTAILGNDLPAVTVGLRGLSYLQVEVTGPNRDLHSGVYGGAVGNPINILCKMITSLQDENNRITIPGFYDNVLEASNEEREAYANIPFNLDHYKEDLAIGEVYGEKGFTTIERTSIRPSLDVNGIWGGYIGEGAKTVLPSKAYAKISMRLVPNQSSERITQLFSDHFQKIAPKSVQVKVTPHHGGEPVLMPLNNPGFLAASKAMEETFGKKPIPVRGGGSIPIVALFEEVLGMKSILMGFGLDSDAIHSPNEHYGVFNYLKGIETIPYFYKYYVDLQKN